jgi:hypothetical protein
LWKERLTTAAEKEAIKNPVDGKQVMDRKLTPRKRKPSSRVEVL